MSTLFYRNPRLLILVVGLILVSGTSSFYLLPRLEDPQMLPRAANVNTIFPGADAERVETLVTEKIEDALREIDEIKRLRTMSRTGISTIAIELLDTVKKPDVVWSRIRDKINDAVPELPEGCRDPEFDQLDIKAYAMLYGVIWQGELDPSYAILRREAKELEDRLKASANTEKVDVFGDPEEQIYVDIDVDHVAALGLTPSSIASQIAASDSKGAAGRLDSQASSFTVEVDGQLDSLERLGKTPIRLGDGDSVVLLSDVALLQKGMREPAQTLARVDGEPAIVLGVMSRSEGRIDHWTEEVRGIVDDFSSQLGSGLVVEELFAQDNYVSERLDGLVVNLIMGGAAVFVVVLLMMGWRSAVVVGASLPLSALMVISGLKWLGIPIQQMSVTGLIIALGLLIDNAIVMVDAVGSRLRQGFSAIQSIRESVKHLAIPLLGSTLTTAFAFAPIALMPGPAGEFVGSIAISVILAIFSSLFLALTVVPTLAALGWRPIPQSEPHPSDEPSTSTRGVEPNSGRPWWKDGVAFPSLAGFYRIGLHWILKHPWRGIAIGAALPMLGFVAATQLDEQFFPPADRDQLYVELELPMGTSLSQTDEMAEAIRRVMVEDSRIESVHWFLGESAPTFYYNVIPRKKGTPRYAQAMVQLTSAVGVEKVIHDYQSRLDQQFPEARVLVRQLEQGPPFAAPIEIRLYGNDLVTLQDLGDGFREILAGIPNVVHTTTELTEPQPKLGIQVDEERARLLGLDHGEMAEQLRGGLDGISGGSLLEGTEEIPVSVRARASTRENLDEIRELDFVARNAASNAVDNDGFAGIPLGSFADVSLQSEIAALPRYNGQRMNEVKAYVKAGVLPATVLSEFNSRYEASDLRLPPGYRFEFGGEAAERDQAIGNLMANVGILAVLMVATLVLSFQSFRLAGAILMVGALSMGLGLGALYLFGYPFGFMAIVGTMGLIGVAINDSIVVLAGLQENDLAREGDLEAMVEVVTEASRHVLSTTLTTIAGFIPLILAGGGFWPPLAVSIAGGVGGATILALMFVPACFRLMVARPAGSPQPTVPHQRELELA